MQTVMGSSVAVSFLNGIIDMLEGMNGMILLAAGLVLNIPGILMCLGLWLMFAQTKRSEGEVSTSGCTLVKVMVVLQFIAVCLVMTAGLIISVAFVVAAGASSSLTSIIVGVVMLLVMILISTLAILFYVQLLFGIKVIRHNVKSERCREEYRCSFCLPAWCSAWVRWPPCFPWRRMIISAWRRRVLPRPGCCFSASG